MLRKGFILNLNAALLVSFPDHIPNLIPILLFSLHESNTLHFHVNTKWKNENEMGNKVTARQYGTQEVV